MSKVNQVISLESLYLDGIRNLSTQRLVFGQDTNLIAGPNGSGKSSVLEGVTLLSTGRSFRSPSVRPVIQHGREHCVVQAQIRRGGTTLSIGIRRGRGGELTLKVDGNEVASLAEFAALLPTIVLDPSSIDLVVGPPEGRRRLIDGALFHVEQTFLEVWRRYQRVLRQRNAALRRGIMGAEDPWIGDLARTGSMLSEHRAQLVCRLTPVFREILCVLSDELATTELALRPGWDQAMSLAEGLTKSVDSDRAQGFTHVGPHRADLRLQWGGRPAAEVMSRGQLKLTMIALRLAQGRIMAEDGGGSPVYLVDDIAAELDVAHADKVCGLLQNNESQVLLTAVNSPEAMRLYAGSAMNLFHVEQGCVTPVDRPF
ncbi:MAG: DNA replication/repair protein RecF [Luminiphilus sp.]|nr:DNA replication/repair protein RecF [Luminiphilus sp.]